VPASEEEKKPETVNRETGGFPAAVPTVKAAGKSPIEAAIARVKDTAIPVEEREKELTEIGRRKDAEALDVLRAIGDERVYLNYAAVEAVGHFSGTPLQTAAGAYLKGKLANPDSQVLCAAIRAYARLLGEEAVPGLAEVLKNNRERPDGHEEIVCTAAVNALRDVCSPAAVPALLVELERSEEKAWSLEYGSQLLEALQKIGTPNGKAGAAAYAQRLSARIPDDPLAKAYFEKKIAEAQEIAKE
jgi:hypothetical protein